VHEPDLCKGTMEDWDRVFNLNGKGVFLCYQYAAKAMIKQGRGGRIIGASSAAGKQGGTSY
jgi:NAD(P)-dependent dehydrogenase (short-subunit alcohol dehydrogenase family)